jgi:hypothetical protein
MIPQDETQERQRLIEKAYAEAKIAEARIKAGERITAEDLMATVLPVVTPPLQDGMLPRCTTKTTTAIWRAGMTTHRIARWNSVWSPVLIASARWRQSRSRRR